MDEELKKQKARERAKRYYEKNKIKILQRQKEYAKRKYHEDEEYRQKRIQNCRNYCERYPERVREIKRLSQKKYYQKYKEYYRQFQKEHSKQYQKNHREKIKKQINNLQEENERLNNIIENIDTYIHLWKLEEIGEKTMLILNDILLIKNGMSNEVIRLKEVNKE